MYPPILRHPLNATTHNSKTIPMPPDNLILPTNTVNTDWSNHAALLATATIILKPGHFAVIISIPRYHPDQSNTLATRKLALGLC